MDHINQHRWPPLSYEQAMEDYKKKYLEEDGHELDEKARAGDKDHDTDTDMKLDKCNVS